MGPCEQGPLPVRIRDATAEDLPAIVGIYNSAVPTRVSTADTEPISTKDRTAWFHAHDPWRRPL
ncbi:MAG: N-acetyltransferase, partial [Actinomycetota bacterium]|nr:N-acetyltransferase [Actinomycetota bacterium]